MKVLTLLNTISHGVKLHPDTHTIHFHWCSIYMIVQKPPHWCGEVAMNTQAIFN